MTVSHYENFDLRIERRATGYALSVTSPAGEAVGMAHALDAPAVAEFVRQASASLSRGREIAPAEAGAAALTREAVMAFGNTLFEGVFREEVLGRWEHSLGLLQGSGKQLRLRLHLEGAPELAGLPWEYLYHHDFLSLSTGTPVVRYLAAPQPIRPLAVKPPLNVLVVIASPTDHPGLQVEREWEQLSAALDDLSRRALVRVRRLAKPTLDGLQEELRRGEANYHVFHFIGHGDFDAEARSGMLLFEADDGTGRRVDAQALKVLLHDADTLRLAVLNACKGARAAQRDPFVGTAQSLLLAGVPAVIAMQFAVSDEAAILFARSFYRALADNLPVDAALGEARKALFSNARAGEPVEWGTPVLFLRADSGMALDLSYAEALSGLTALAELLRTSPAVRAHAARYRNDFATARTDIDRLGDYKDLHDQLHHLQFHVYSLIVGKLRSVLTPAGDGLREELRNDDGLLETSEVALLGILEALRGITGRASFPAFDTAWLSHLEQAHAALLEAILTLDVGALKHVRSYLDRVLNVQPARLNTELEFTARQLRLPQVVQDMTELRDNLGRLRPDDPTLTQFASGVEALTRLGARLASLLEQHVAWQTIDAYLRALLDSGIGGRFAREPELLVEDWRDLIRDKAEPMARARQDGLSERLLASAAKVDEALARNHVPGLERGLEEYRRFVDLLFFRVDTDLKLACDELRRVGAPLDAVLGVLGEVA